MQFNTDQSLGFKRPLLVSQSRGLYRAFAEIDFRQLVSLKNTILNAKKTLTKADIGDIEPNTVNCVYKDETFWSIFAEQGIIYEVFLDQIRNQERKQMISSDEFDLLLRRMKYVITRPSPVFAKDFTKEITKMSILKQCIIFNDQRSRVSMYKLADFLDLDICDYISCTADLKQVIQ